MQARDVAVAQRLSDDAFFELDTRSYPRDWPAPERRTPAHVASWEARTQHFLEHDAGGCWVAEDASGVVGFATSFVRERAWCLATYAVRPDLQGHGVGRRLLDAAGGVRRALPDRAPLGIDRPAGRASLLALGVRAAPADVPPRPGRRRAGAARRRGTGWSRHRHRADGRHRPGPAGRRARARPRRPGGDGPAAGRGDGDGPRVRLHRRRPPRRPRRDRRGHRPDAALGVPGRRRPGVRRAARDRRRTSGRSTSALTAGLTLAQSGYLGLRGMAPPAPYVHNGALL